MICYIEVPFKAGLTVFRILFILFFVINLYCIVYFRWKELQISLEDRLKNLQSANREYGPDSQHFLSSKSFDIANYFSEMQIVEIPQYP